MYTKRDTQRHNPAIRRNTARAGYDTDTQPQTQTDTDRHTPQTHEPQPHRHTHIGPQLNGRRHTSHRYTAAHTATAKATQTQTATRTHTHTHTHTTTQNGTIHVKISIFVRAWTRYMRP